MRGGIPPQPDPTMTETVKKLTLAAVNNAVKARGVNAVLYRGKEGYYYFDGPDVEWAYSSSVGVFRLNHLTMAQWMDSLDRIILDHNKRRPDGEPEVLPLPAPTPWLDRVVTLRPTQGDDQTSRTARVVAETEKRVQVELPETGRTLTFNKADGQPATKLDRDFPGYVMEQAAAESTPLHCTGPDYGI